VKYWNENHEGRSMWKMCIDWKMILKWILKEWNVRVWDLDEDE
jgi:hypothetical protein